MSNNYSETHAVRILTRHFENVGGEYASKAERQELIDAAVKAGEGALWPANRKEIEAPLYAFIRQRGTELDKSKPEPGPEMEDDEAVAPIQVVDVDRIPETAPVGTPLPPGLSDGLREQLADNGIHTLESLDAWKLANGSFNEMDGVGVKKAAALDAILAAWLDESEDPEPEGGSDEGEEADSETTEGATE